MRTFLFVLLTYSIASPAFAEDAKAKPYLMVTVGDSISAGFIAETSAINTRANRETLLKDDGSQADGLPFKLQIGQALNNKETLSWSSGSELSSHFVKLQEYLKRTEPGASLVVKNVAKSGAKAEYLPKEAGDLMSEWYSGKYRALKYVTLLIGANDACDATHEGGTPDLQFSQSLHTFFLQLSTIHQSEPIHVLVSSVPKIPDIARPEIFNHELAHNITCRKIELSVTQFCNPILNWTTPEEYQEGIARVERKNAALRAAVESAKTEFPNLEIAFSEALFSQNIVLEKLATDCFHPNKQGQTDLSEMMWDDQPWFK